MLIVVDINLYTCQTYKTDMLDNCRQLNSPDSPQYCQQYDTRIENYRYKTLETK